tara:strand:- start:6 stop:215 length:210 start_codon:yes stop_codon:yes gene_type:complete
MQDIAGKMAQKYDETIIATNTNVSARDTSVSRWRTFALHASKDEYPCHAVSQVRNANGWYALFCVQVNF